MLTGEASPLASEDRLIRKPAPAALTLHFQQQRWMSFQGFAGWSLSFQPQTHNPWRSIPAGRITMAWALWEQGYKAPLLIIELQIAMGRPLAISRIPMTIKPCLASTTQPTAQQPVIEDVVGRRGVTHRATLRRPAARS